MAGSLNKVQLIGNLGRDPEVRNTQSGDQIVHLSIATNETWRDRQSGERRDRTEWHRVVIFNQNIGDVAKQYLRKGSKVYVEGQLQTRKWTGQDGQERYTTEIALRPYRGELTMLDSRGDTGGGGDFGEPDYNSSINEPAPSGGSIAGADIDDEIPF